MSSLACVAALVLLMDVSGSIDAQEYDLQRDGTANAFRDAEVVRVITNKGPVAVTLLEFASSARVAVDWRVIRSHQDAVMMANAIAATARSDAIGGSTNIAAGLSTSFEQLERVPCQPEEQIIDISGDGRHSGSGGVTPMRAYAIEHGIRINALAILGEPNEPDLVGYFREEVATPGGFVIPAADHFRFAWAMRMKLTLELANSWTRRPYARSAVVRSNLVRGPGVRPGIPR